MSLKGRTEDGLVRKIVEAINSAADGGQSEIDFGDYDVDITEKVRERVCAEFDGELDFDGYTASWK